MLVQESTLGEIPCSKDMSDTTNESEETLSLCDLPLYSDQSADWDRDLSLASNSMSSSQDDCFEFFSQELNPSATEAAAKAAADSPPGNIIFCGKLIPYKQHDILDSSNIAEIKDQTDNKKKRGWPIFMWKFSSSRSSKRQVPSKNGTRCTTSLVQQSPRKINTNKLGKGHGRMSIFTASSSSGKAKWYLFLFGISRFSPVVDLRDIKSRQSRRHCPSPSSPPPSPMFGIQDRDDILRNSGWGLWGLIRALSCGGNHQSTTTATAS